MKLRANRNTLPLNGFLLLLTIIFLIPHCSLAQKRERKEAIENNDTLKWSVDLLKHLLKSGSEWYLVDENYRKPVKGVVDHVNYVPIDTLVKEMREILEANTSGNLFERRPQDIREKSRVSGYIEPSKEEELVEERRRTVVDSLHKTSIQLPDEILADALKKAPLVPQGPANNLFFNSKQMVPISFMSKFNRSLSSMALPPNMTGTEMDSLRALIFNQSRQAYNDSVISQASDSLLVIYKERFIREFAQVEMEKLRKSIADQNLKTLSAFNETEVNQINDSLKIALHFLANRADADSALVRLTNLSGEVAPMWTANRQMSSMRTYLKNAQNDSLAVILNNLGKGRIQLIIDDGVKFQRFVETQKKEIKFNPQAPDNRLVKVNIKKPEALAWNLFGNGTISFTQTHLSNWSKGGESAMSLLFVGKYNANYAKHKVKWENGGELRYGINQTKVRGFEKNDDKIEFQSRFGYAAFKKWYYSLEGNFRTQIAKGYKYPNKENPISAFMAPGYLTFSIGMDYKPHKNFSLFLSPMTSKTTFIRDTTLINPANFGLEPGMKRLWEPGLIIKSYWKTAVRENINYETKGEFFNNYRFPFKKMTFEWEQILIMQVTRHINTRFMTQLIYDYNTKFPVYDSEGNQTGKEPKWQFKELLSVGFTYKF